MNTLEDIRQTRLEIDLDRLVANMRRIRDFTPDDVAIMAVIKSDAYSHGAVRVAPLLMENGGDMLAVATLNEALELRKNGLDYPVLIFGYTQATEMEKLIKNRISQTIYSLDQARDLSRQAGDLGLRAGIHIKIDTGMSRLGFRPGQESLEEIRELMELDNLEVQGIFSHFAESEAQDKSYTRAQYEEFMDFLGQLEAQGLKFPLRHISNAAAHLELPQYNLDMVRLGISMFGIYPNYEEEAQLLDLDLSFKLKTHIAHIKELEPGTSISYNRTYFTQKKERIATLPLGYADGFFQELADKVGVHIGGVRAPVVGKVCMDQTMVDISHIEGLKVGDTVEVLTDQVQGLIKARDIATISRRVPRVYLSQGRIVDSVDYLLD